MPKRRPSRTKDAATGWRQQPGRETSLLFDVFVLGQQTKSLVAAALRDAGLRPDEYAAYSVVFEAGSITLTEMAGRLGMPVTTVADYARTMFERGHARKRPHPRDHRAHLLALTPAGLRAHRRASEAFDRASAALAADLPLEEDAARRMVRELANGAERAARSLQGLPAARADPAG